MNHTHADQTSKAESGEVAGRDPDAGLRDASDLSGRENTALGTMGPMGVAPKLLPYLVPPFLMAIAFQLIAPRAATFEGPLRGLCYASGLYLAVLGVLSYADLATRLIVALKTGRLVTRGAYAICRHPLYAWWVFLAFPAAALLLDNWIFLVAAAATAVATHRHAGEEERDLELRFGEAYRGYRERTRFLLPFPRLRGQGGRGFFAAAAYLAALGGLALTSYLILLAPAMSHFGATWDERLADYPGDSWILRPDGGFTEAVTIDAPPAYVWPWLIQVGYRRAGWYNIDAINSLAAPDYFIDGSRSSRRIVPELQDLTVGDEIYLVPGLGFSVTGLEPNRLLLLTSGTKSELESVNAGASASESFSAASWCFLLTDLGDGRTRLVSRFRSIHGPLGPVVGFLYGLVTDFGGAALQQPAMFYGLARRAEGKLR